MSCTGKFLLNLVATRLGHYSSGAAAEIASTTVKVRVLSLLSASDPKLRFPTADMMLQLSRRSRRAPARPVSSAAATAGVGERESSLDIAKDIIEARGLRALWAVAQTRLRWPARWLWSLWRPCSGGRR